MKKSLSTKWKVIIFCMAIIVAMTSTGFTVWAIARNYFRYNADFEVNITGGRYVNASITGASYIAGSGTSYETLDTATFNGETENETSILAFKNPITMQNDEQVSKLRFEITNNSPYSNHNDLIVKPSITTEDIDDVIISWYYSTDDVNYFAYAEEYLVAHKNNTLYLELRMLATVNLFGNVSFEDSVAIDMYSEMEPPADFSYEYDYEYDETTTTATKTQVCPTCDLCAHTYATETMDESEYIVEGSSLDVPYDEKISNKVIFLTAADELDAAGLENVVICPTTSSNLSMLFIRLNISSAETTYNNVTIKNITFSEDFIISISSSISDAKNYVNNLKLINCVFAYAPINLNNSHDAEFNIDNLLIKDCTVSSSGAPGDSYTISNVNNLIWENSGVLNRVDLIFNNVNNVILTNNGSFVQPILQNVGGNIYIINNKVDWVFTIKSTNSGAKIFIKNNIFTLANSPYHLAIIETATSTTLEAENNNYNYGSGDNFKPPIKYNDLTSTSETTIY